MKLYLSHSGSFDYQAELYEPLKQTLAKKYDIFFPHDPGNVDVKARDVIAESNFVLAEVSHSSTGQGIELGWADSAAVPIVCFYRSGSKVSGALRFVSDVSLEYSSEQDMADKLDAWLSKV